MIETKSQKKKLLVNFFILIIALTSFSKREKAFQETSVFEGFLHSVFYPLQSGVSNLKKSTGALFDNYLSNVEAKKDNKVLKGKIERLEMKESQLEEILRENQRLKKLLQYGKEIKLDKVLARVVGWNANSQFKVVRINKGKKSGISLYSTVVTSKGVVGYVYKMTDNFSDVLTILDSNNRVDGLVQRTRSHGVVEGFSADRCLMKYVKRVEPVRLSDFVITSGLGTIYPKGLIIGRISKIERESFGVTQNIEIEPSVDFSTMEEVIILVRQDSIQEEQESLDASSN